MTDRQEEKKAAIESGELVLPVYESKVTCATRLTEIWTPVIEFSGEIHIGDLRGDSERAVDLNNLLHILRKYAPAMITSEPAVG